MANHRRHRHRRPPGTLLIPLGIWLGISVVVAVVALVLALKQAPGPPKASLSQGSGAFSLTALHERLPEDAKAQVQRYINYFRESRRRGFSDSLARSTRYVERFKEIFREEGLPEELAFLPLIESGFVETAVSPAKAVGVWQFIEETGRRYNLERNSWFDRRRDPISSAKAAASYLAHLHEEFKDWDLALAAYNSGAGTVRWAQRVNRRAGEPQHYWSLELPEETRNYVPAFIASVLIAKNPAAYGFHKIDFHPEIEYEVVKVSPGTSLALLEVQLDLQERTLFNLNSELTRGVVPPGDVPYALRVPPGYAQPIAAKLAYVQTQPNDWMLHHVQYQDTVQSLARRFRARPATIKEVNRLQDNGELLQRRFVIIPL